MRMQRNSTHNSRSSSWSWCEQIHKRRWTIAVFSLAIILHSSTSEYTDACHSLQGKIGTCIPLNTCPLFLSWLKARPLVKENVRLLVKYTCYFDIRNPKVCCPNDSLYGSRDEFDVGFRIGAPSRLPESRNHDNKLLFPVSSLTFPSPLSNIVKPLKRNDDNLPLSFPTDHPSRGKSIIKNAETSLKPDFRQHPNFRLIPTLAECSNAVKLDSLLETYGAYPWIALIGLKPGRRSLDFDHFCAGIIINKRYIVSSAHCYQQANPRYVRLGEYDLDTLIDQGNEYLPQSRREDVRIEKLTPHPDFNPTTFANDIALIRLEKPLELNTTFIKAACLPFLTEYGIENRLNTNNISEFDGKPAWTAGWSRHSWDGLYSKGSDSSVIEEGIVEFTAHDKCRHDYPHMSALNSRTQLCVGGKGRRNSCVADSGGPLMVPVKVPSKISGFVEPKFFMLGLLSHGPTGRMCQNANDNEGRSLPTSVYTRISKYFSWILDNMQD
ncbi:Serine protease easter [Orchesella cincta]|uniref:CLIP domain-containing serine protease n=1 Tax=Orchesella cincta TaxID=48709 RepID=A0A1D2MD92_ORCCI|nr:Serine protease easter [Orchesella cincta]